MHDGNVLSHLFFLLWHREHEARALAGAEDCAADVAGHVPLSRVIGEEQTRKDVTSRREQGVLRGSVGWELPELQNLEY